MVLPAATEEDLLVTVWVPVMDFLSLVVVAGWEARALIMVVSVVVVLMLIISVAAVVVVVILVVVVVVVVVHTVYHL